MLCESCGEKPATVHVTQIVHPDQVEGAKAAAPGEAPDTDPSASPGTNVVERHLCEACSMSANLPHPPVIKKSVTEIWKLLQASATQGRKEGGLACPDCGMTLMEFRQKGRLGCPKDYEVFTAQLRDLLERIHGATRHVGRLPGLDDESLAQRSRVADLQAKLASAIRDEAYEDAAALRDELKSLQDG